MVDAQVESLAAARRPARVRRRQLHQINGVAQKSLAKLRLSDGARITAFKGRTNARVKDMAVSGGRLYIGGTFNTANGVARSAPAGPTTVVTTGLGTSRGLLVLNLPT